MTRSATVLLGLVSLLACSGPLEVAPENLTFNAEQVRPGSQLPIPETTAEGESGAIRFQGALDTPVPCYEIGGAAVAEGRRIALEVTATPLDGVCIQVLATFGYEATLMDVPPGTYPVEIVHVREGERDVAFQGDITVE